MVCRYTGHALQFGLTHVGSRPGKGDEHVVYAPPLYLVNVWEII